jgi:4-aminobutyrate aminotransferase / (S)-3-amino-2-methylpropionate transaminase
MAEGGDVFISSEFAQALRDLTEELGIYMIVDEVQTGVGVSGKMWAHENWNLTSPPDYVTFAKKMLSSGFFYADDHDIVIPNRHFNTYMGDLPRFLLTKELVQVIQEESLCDLAATSGHYLRSRLEELQKKHSSLIKDIRGMGTFLAMDIATVEQRDELLKQLKLHGIN